MYFKIVKVKNLFILSFFFILLGCATPKTDPNVKKKIAAPVAKVSSDLLKGMTKTQLQNALNTPNIMVTGAHFYDDIRVSKNGDNVTLLFKGSSSGGKQERDFTFKSNDFTEEDGYILKSVFTKDEITKNMACYQNECFAGKTIDQVRQKIIDENFPPRTYLELRDSEKEFVNNFIDNAKFGDMKITEKNTLEIYSETLPTSLSYSNFGSILKEEITGGIMDETNKQIGISYFAYGDVDKIKPFNNNATYTGKTFATAQSINETDDNFIEKTMNLTGTVTLNIDIAGNDSNTDNIETLTIAFDNYYTLNYIKEFNSNGVNSGIKFDNFAGSNNIDSDFDFKGVKTSGSAEYNGYSNIATDSTPSEAVGVYQFTDGEIYNGVKINGSFGVKKQ
ncbi:MAG: hypothetical protein Ta2D_01950 [Rickettsiales bacterium]|nr:MAG: hypothetical protein Ta2D_01950 [Rickettsiales bacterium]